MAIRFVDVDGKAEPTRPKAGAAAPESEPLARRPPPVAESDDEPASDEKGGSALPLAKPEPKPRGRKKPLAATLPVRAKEPDGTAAPLLDGLVLPEIQAHAKPIPKPRGRKKAFG